MKIFDSIQVQQPKRNAFDLSHEVKMSGNMGKLIPMFIQETIPGDKFINNSEIFLRLMPMLAPVMHRVDVYTHFFFVPNRIVFEQWDKFIAKEKVGGLDVVLPKLLINDDTAPYHKKGSVSDYFGIKPVTQDDIDNSLQRSLEVSALPYLAYHKIWNDYYRDQNLEEEFDIKTACSTLQSSPGNVALIEVLGQLRNRAYEKDYLTSALPNAQKGDAVTIPLGDSAPINFIQGTNAPLKRTEDITLDPDGAGTTVDLTAIGGTEVGIKRNGGAKAVVLDNSEFLEADLTQATATTINDLRRAFKLQEWLERNARAGSRYIELILSHFGRRVKDYRLQRPEYIGGGKQPVVISEVLSTLKTATEPQGNMTGHGVSLGKTNSFSYECDEHGFIIGLMSVMPRTSYMQSVPRMFKKFDALDYYWPSFAQLGEQEIDIDEVLVDYSTPRPEITTFGYQSRYAEYKYQQSRVAGEMRDTLLSWHLSRKFTEPNEGGQYPALNEDFIKCDPSHRIFAVTDPDEHKLIIQVFNYTKGIRPIPYFNNPSIL